MGRHKARCVAVRLLMPPVDNRTYHWYTAEHLRSFSVLLRSVPSHCASSTVPSPWTAYALAGDLWSGLSAGEGPSPAVRILVSPAFLASDSSAPSDSAGGPWRCVGVSLASCPLAFPSHQQSPVFHLSDATTMAEVARAAWPHPRFVAPQDRHRVNRCVYATFGSTAPGCCLGLFSRTRQGRA